MACIFRPVRGNEGEGVCDSVTTLEHMSLAQVNSSVSGNLEFQIWSDSIDIIDDEILSCLCSRHTPTGAQLGVNRSNLLLRGCVLRNTNAVVGVVVYAGEEVCVRQQLF